MISRCTAQPQRHPSGLPDRTDCHPRSRSCGPSAALACHGGGGGGSSYTESTDAASTEYGITTTGGSVAARDQGVAVSAGGGAIATGTGASQSGTGNVATQQGSAGQAGTGNTQLVGSTSIAGNSLGAGDVITINQGDPGLATSLLQALQPAAPSAAIATAAPSSIGDPIAALTANPWLLIGGGLAGALLLVLLLKRQ